MKKFFMVSALVASLLLAGCGGSAPVADDAVATKTAAGPTAIFEMNDIGGDDNGPGTYTYPTDKVFVPGCFDLTGFKIVDGGDTYDFMYTMATDFKNDWKNAGGWDVQLFDTYLNLGAAKNTMAIQGRHVKFSEGWDVAIMVGADKPTRMQREIDDKNADVGDDISDFEDLTADILLPDEIVIEGDTLTAKVAKDRVGDLGGLKGVQTFILGNEGYPTKLDTYNRVVNEYAAQWRLGGGTDYDGDPNVIDMLGNNSKLGDYKSDEGVTEYPTVDLIPVK